MSTPDPALLRQAQDAIAAVHRRPVSLRRSDVTSSESVLRGARISALIDAWPAETAINVASLLAPDAIDQSARIFLRAPLQSLARMDVLAGGDGKPVANVAALQQLAQVVGVQGVFLPGLVHGVVLAYTPFAERSGIIARAASRLAAVATGFDPRGLTVPEVHLNRNRSAYLSAGANFFADPTTFMNLQLQAFIAGAAEAESIAAQAS